MTTKSCTMSLCAYECDWRNHYDTTPYEYLELDRHEWLEHRRLITKLEILPIPGYMKFRSTQNLTIGRNNGIWKATLGNNVFLMAAHNRNTNPSKWPDNVLLVFCYFLSAIPTLKVSFYVCGIKHVFTYLLKWRLHKSYDVFYVKTRV